MDFQIKTPLTSSERYDVSNFELRPTYCRLCACFASFLAVQDKFEKIIAGQEQTIFNGC